MYNPAFGTVMTRTFIAYESSIVRGCAPPPDPLLFFLLPYRTDIT